MGTPFVSVSYEQKMQGFMKKAGLLEYCLPISELSANSLSNKFEGMMSNYDEYKSLLAIKKAEFKKESSKQMREEKMLIDEGKYGKETKL